MLEKVEASWYQTETWGKNLQLSRETAILLIREAFSFQELVANSHRNTVKS